MGTPDIKGTQGIFSFYTTETVNDEVVQGRVLQVLWKDNKIKTFISGPKRKNSAGTKEIQVPIELERISNNKIQIKIQDHVQTIGVGEWSPWFRVDFGLGLLQSVSGIVRFHLNALEPDLALYASPVNINPEDPAMVISHPRNYSKVIGEKLGYYYTQGMPYDTWALNEDRIDEEAFLEMAYQIQDENLKLLNHELAKFEGGLLFCYFGITDLIQHMFWRYTDPLHPNPGKNPNPKVKNAIEDVYIHMDGVLKNIEEKVDSNTFFLVLSDHGFGSFRRTVHLNSWLRDNGFLVLRGLVKEGEELFSNVDWSQSKAYSLGFGGIYVNEFGREKYGIVYKGKEKQDLKQELVEKLLKWKDLDRSKVIYRVYDGRNIYTGPYSGNGPDLFVGFNKNYRASWQTALGAAPGPLLEDNMKKWGGDHLCDPDLVPGVLLSNRNLSKRNPQLVDLAPTILFYFGVSGEEKMEGKPLF